MGPELTGAGKNGVRYFLENIIDPDAVIGADFQMTVLQTKSGDVLSGLVSSESPSAVTLRTATLLSEVCGDLQDRRLIAKCRANLERR